jgi:hypothetical protein
MGEVSAPREVRFRSHPSERRWYWALTCLFAVSSPTVFVALWSRSDWHVGEAVLCAASLALFPLWALVLALVNERRYVRLDDQRLEHHDGWQLRSVERAELHGYRINRYSQGYEFFAHGGETPRLRVPRNFVFDARFDDFLRGLRRVEHRRQRR